MREGVVLLHGIFRTSRSMRRLEKFLNGHGYATLNMNYPSRRHDLSGIVDRIHPVIDDFRKRHDVVHYVVHSMGGLVLRAYLNRHIQENVTGIQSRIVMLGTPNHGSELADYFQNWWLYRRLYGPAGQQLVTDQSGFSNIFGEEIAGEIGCLAGSCSWEPIADRIIGRPNDGKVSIESTKLPFMRDHLVLPITHSWMPLNEKIRPYVLNFLKKGCFL